LEEGSLFTESITVFVVNWHQKGKKGNEDGEKRINVKAVIAFLFIN